MQISQKSAFQTAGDLGNIFVLRCAVAGVRLLGARDGGRGAAAAAALSAESRKRALTGGGEKSQNEIPELPDGRLASETADSCFPLIYLQQEETLKEGGRERVGVLSRHREQRHLLSAPLPVCCSVLRDLHSLRRRTASVCVCLRGRGRETGRTDPAETKLITHSAYRSQRQSHRSPCVVCVRTRACSAQDNNRAETDHAVALLTSNDQNKRGGNCFHCIHLNFAG